MNIVKMGYENDDLQTMEISCTGGGIHNEKKACGARLEINFLDIRQGFHHDYGGGVDKYYYIICPICGAKTEVYEEDMPTEIRNSIN